MKRSEELNKKQQGRESMVAFGYLGIRVSAALPFQHEPLQLFCRIVLKICNTLESIPNKNRKTLNETKNPETRGNCQRTTL
jgi:hypothetical protein